MTEDSPHSTASGAEGRLSPRQPSCKPDLPPPPASSSGIEDPWWWRAGSIPFIVLFLIVVAAECSWPGEASYGVGAGVSCALVTLALLLLRRDFSRWEQCFLIGLAVVNLLALSFSGSTLNFVVGLLFPFVLVLFPSPRASQKRAGKTYRTWWEYWFAHRPRVEKGGQSLLRRILPLFLSCLAGVTLFIIFMCIFASGNPVVQLVWETLVGWWNEMVTWLNISWDFFLHVLYWLLGIVWFGLYTVPRPESASTPAPPSEEPVGETLLPHLPLFCLLGVNLAFLVATSTDMLFLWLHRVPEGISQTDYLYEGSSSIIWAALLAAGILVFFFRRQGSARRSTTACVAGYVLAIQTLLLAVSVYMRLYYQIADYGFTPRRLQAAETLLLGMGGLVILILYMSRTGHFWKYTRLCVGTLLLMTVAFSIYPPSRMAGDLNLRYASTHPRWKFSHFDFGPTRFQVKNNLEFAWYVQRIAPHERLGEELLTESQRILTEQQQAGWRGWSLFLSRDEKVAERLLGSISSGREEESSGQ